jgi:hypothetical protein
MYAFENQHYWYNALKNDGPATILGCLAIALFLYLQLKKFIRSFLGLLTNDGRNCCPRVIRKYWVDSVEIDEDVPDYDEVLSTNDRKFTLAEELNIRMFGVETMLNESYSKLEILEEPASKKYKHLTGIHSYDILRNPSYIT